MSVAARRYETVVVFDPSLGEAQVKDEMGKISGILTTHKAEDVKPDAWGKRELAYKVGKSKYGFYASFHYASLSGEIVSTLSNLLRLSETVLKFQTHRISDRVRKFKGNPRRASSGGFDFDDSVDADY